MREELDFTIERDNMRSFAASLDGVPRPTVRAPRPVGDLCTARVLVMERMTGTPLGSGDRALAGLACETRREMAAALLDTMLDQVLVHGMFHVDIHPGNVLVDDVGTLGLLDFGSAASTAPPGWPSAG